MGEPVPPLSRLDEVRLGEEVREALAEGASLATVTLIRETGRPAKANPSIDAGVLAAIDEEVAVGGSRRGSS